MPEDVQPEATEHLSRNLRGDLIRAPCDQASGGELKENGTKEDWEERAGGKSEIMS